MEILNAACKTLLMVKWLIPLLFLLAASAVVRAKAPASPLAEYVARAIPASAGNYAARGNSRTASSSN